MKELKQYLTEDGIKCFKHLAEALSEELKKRAMAYKDDVFPLRLKVFGFKGMQWSNRDEMIGAINMIDNNSIKNHEELYNILSKYSPGENITIKTRISGQTFFYNVTLIESPINKNQSFLGVVIGNDQTSSFKGFISNLLFFKRTSYAKDSKSSIAQADEYFGRARSSHRTRTNATRTGGQKVVGIYQTARSSKSSEQTKHYRGCTSFAYLWWKERGHHV